MAFNLADMLKTVPDSGTREQIEYIPREKLRADEQNFYQISAMDSLVENIELIGLQQPLRVRADGDTYRIVSGHRRFAAITNLAAEDPQRWETIPCIVERDDASPELQQLRLIYGNLSTRVLNSAELGEQAEQVRSLLYQLKEQGMEFPGRMRDHVAECVNINKTRLGKLDVIRKKLDKCWAEDYKSEKIKEDTAYRLAQIPAYLQNDIYRITQGMDSKLPAEAVSAAENLDRKIRTGKLCGVAVCPNRQKMMARVVKKRMTSYYTPDCPGCCKMCNDRFTCGASCDVVAEEKKEHRATEKQAKERAEEAAAQRLQPQLDSMAKCYKRLYEAAEERGASMATVAETCYGYASTTNTGELLKLGTGEKAPTAYTRLPYRWGIDYDSAQRLVATAELLGVSTDYLLGRDGPKPVSGWHSWPQEVPQEDGDYVVTYRAGDLIRTSVGVLEWLEGEWFVGLGTGPQDLNWTVLKWIKFPEVEK